MVFQVQPDLRIKSAPVLLSVSLCLAAACFHPTHSRTRTFPTCMHTYTALFGWGLSVLTVPRGCSGTPWGYFTRHSQSSCPQHKLRSESRQIFVRGKAQAVVLVTRDRKHHEAASPLTSKQHRQVFSSHSPPTTPETVISYNHFLSPLSATHPLQGTYRILLDELLVTGIADALRVNARWEGQLIC